MINIYKFYHCQSLLATPGFEPKTFRSQSGDANQNFEIGARAQGDAQFRANLWSGRKNCPRLMCVPKLKIVAFSVCEILRASQNFEIGARTPGDVQFWANLWSGGKNCPQPMCMPNLKIVALSVCEILRGSQNFEIGSRTPGHTKISQNPIFEHKWKAYGKYIFA